MKKAVRLLLASVVLGSATAALAMKGNVSKDCLISPDVCSPY